MAYTLEKIKDTTTIAVFKLTGTNGTDTPTIDCSTLNSYIAASIPLVDITRISWNVYKCSLKISFDGDTPSDALVLSYANDIDFTEYMMSIPNTATVPTGGITFTPLDYSAASSYCVVIELKKKSGFTMITN